MEYAVYVVVIEDSSEADAALAAVVDTLERIAADKSYPEATAIVEEVNAQYPFVGI